MVFLRKNRHRILCPPFLSGQNFPSWKVESFRTKKNMDPLQVRVCKRISSWWLNQPIWKICSSNWESSPGRDENKKYLKPPPRCCLQLWVFSGLKIRYHKRFWNSGPWIQRGFQYTSLAAPQLENDKFPAFQKELRYIHKITSFKDHPLKKTSKKNQVWGPISFSSRIYFSAEKILGKHLTGQGETPHAVRSGGHICQAQHPRGRCHGQRAARRRNARVRTRVGCHGVGNL